jgi:parvulin-like peptidyl-prolyl isomerase
MPEPFLQNLSPDALALLRRHNLLKALIRADVTATAVQTIVLSQEECDQLWSGYLTQKKIEDDVALNGHLQELGMTAEDLHWQLELPQRTLRYSQEHFQHKAEARFLARKEQLDRVVYSLLRVNDGFLARELYLRIAGREANFADLAAEHSQGPEAKTKGIVGPVPMRQAHPALSERLRTSHPGQLLEPFQIDQWWLVARLERYEAARFDEATSEQMTTELFQEWIQEQMLGKMAQL